MFNGMSPVDLKIQADSWDEIGTLLSPLTNLDCFSLLQWSCFPIICVPAHSGRCRLSVTHVPNLNKGLEPSSLKDAAAIRSYVSKEMKKTLGGCLRNPKADEILEKLFDHVLMVRSAKL